MASFSIAMGTYNGASFLAEQLESLINQELKPLELIVGDDGSTDGTLAILNDFSVRAPFPVRITANAKQLGYGENFIQAASRCTGDWVAFCDQDDVWFPSKLSKCAEVVASGPPDLALVIHGAIVGDANLTEISRTDWPKAGLYKRFTLPPNFLIQGFRQVLRRSLLNEIPFSARRIPWIGEPEAHDAWACLIASVTGSIAVLDDDLVVYRRHEANTTEASGLLHPRTLLERIRGKVRDNSEDYKKKSELYDLIAAYLRAQSDNQLTASRRHQFLSASKRVGLLKNRFDTRAQINGVNPVSKRFEAYCTLALAGGYASKRQLGFGTIEAAIDLIRVLLPNL